MAYGRLAGCWATKRPINQALGSLPWYSVHHTLAPHDETHKQLREDQPQADLLTAHKRLMCKANLIIYEEIKLLNYINRGLTSSSSLYKHTVQEANYN